MNMYDIAETRLPTTTIWRWNCRVIERRARGASCVHVMTRSKACVRHTSPHLYNTSYLSTCIVFYLLDWLTDLRLNVPLFSDNLWASAEKSSG